MKDNNKKRYTSLDQWKDTRQPLDYKKTGRVNPDFDKLYSDKTHNPFWGTDRDPNKNRQEYSKRKSEYEKYRNEMSANDKFDYEKYLKNLRDKIK